MNTQIDNYLTVFNGLNFEKIKDHPNILIAANFWEEDRYNAAKTCYKFMRAIDDLIDNYKADHEIIAENEKRRFMTEVNNWINGVKDKTNNNPMHKELIETLDKFQIPILAMEAFAKSMIYDIHHDGFNTLQKFLEYTEGASIAPASIFVHLCGIKSWNGHYSAPSYDVKKAASPCATFSYLVHIIRDFQKDQTNNLNYFADDLILKNSLTKQDLRKIAFEGVIKKGFRDLMWEYYVLADKYRRETYDMIEEISPFLEPRYQLSLEIIFNLYQMVFERIDVENGKFTALELNPTSDEIKERVFRTINDFKEVFTS
jgi:phytoene/squalene synthetase